jgi:dTDP-4-amino-4,6-dideoxygalactose transaminase
MQNIPIKIKDRGEQMAEKRIYLASPHMSGEGYETDYIREAFETNWIAPLGKNVDGFEEETARLVGVGYAAALSSGTAAVHLALKAAGVDRDDVVFCQSLTFSASANPIVYLGARPVFIGSTERTWNMDPAALEDAFKKYRPKAVVAVNLYGMSAELDEISALCRKNGAVLVEDAAESLGTRYKGRWTGTVGDFGVYSFNGNKIITTSGGGMVVSDNKERIEKIRFWATQSRDPARHYQHSELGYNYRLSNVLAGIGRGQLRVLGKRVEKKREIFAYYKKALAGLDGVGFMPENDWDEPNRWLTAVTLSGRVRPNDVIDALEKENIESRPVWKPLHLQPFFAACDYIGGGAAEWIFNNGVCLPSDTKLGGEELRRVTDTIGSLWK